MPKGVICVAMLMSAAGAELSSTAAVGQQSAIPNLRLHTSTAVRVPPQISTSCSLSYCCGPVHQYMFDIGRLDLPTADQLLPCSITPPQRQT